MRAVRSLTRKKKAAVAPDDAPAAADNLDALLGKADGDLPVPAAQVEEEASFFFQRFDLDGNGVIDFSEFAELVDEIGMLPHKDGAAGAPRPPLPLALPAEDAAPAPESAQVHTRFEPVPPAIRAFMDLAIL